MIGRDRDAQCCPRFSGQRQIAMKTIPPLLGFAAKTPAFYMKSLILGCEGASVFKFWKF